VVAVMGDGGFGFMMEELAMACQHKVPVVVVIVNNGYLSLIRQNQRYAYEYEYGVDLAYDGAGIDFVRLAEAFGAHGERVVRPEELKSALQRAAACGKPAVVDVVGDIDLNRSLEFQHSLLKVLDDKPQRIVVNLSGVPYMDSSGVASLVKLLSRARKGGAALCLAGLNDRVRSVFEITRLDSVFTICATVEEALA